MRTQMTGFRPSVNSTTSPGPTTTRPRRTAPGAALAVGAHHHQRLPLVERLELQAVARAVQARGAAAERLLGLGQHDVVHDLGGVAVPLAAAEQEVAAALGHRHLRPVAVAALDEQLHVRSGASGTSTAVPSAASTM